MMTCSSFAAAKPPSVKVGELKKTGDDLGTPMYWSGNGRVTVCLIDTATIYGQPRLPATHYTLTTDGPEGSRAAAPVPARFDGTTGVDLVAVNGQVLEIRITPSNRKGRLEVDGDTVITRIPGTLSSLRVG